MSGGTVTINTELLVMSSIGLMSTVMEGSYNSVTQHLDDIWKLALPDEWFGIPFEHAAKTIMAMVIVARSVTLHLYVIAYLLMMYAVLTERGSYLMVFWIFLAAMRSIFLNLVSTLTGILICAFCPCTRATCFEFAVVKGVELASSVYLWLTVGGYYIKLRDCAQGRRQPGMSAIEQSESNAQEDVPGDFVEWLSAYGRDRAELIKKILEMSKQELLTFHEKLRNICGQSGRRRAPRSQESPCSQIEDIQQTASTSLEYSSPDPTEEEPCLSSPERNVRPKTSKTPKSQTYVKKKPIQAASEHCLSPKTSTVDVEIEAYSLDTTPYTCKIGTKDRALKPVRSDISQRSEHSKYLKPVRSDTSHRSERDKYLKPVRSDISQQSDCDKFLKSISQRSCAGKYMKTFRSNISDPDPYDKRLKPVRSNTSQKGVCDKSLKPVRSNTSQKGVCDKSLKPVRSNTSQKGVCDKSLKPVRSNTSQKGVCDKSLKPVRSNTSQKGVCDKSLKPVRSNTSQKGAYDKCKTTYTPQKIQYDKYVKPPNMTQQGPCDKYPQPAKSDISNKCLKPVRSNTSQKGAYDKAYDKYKPSYYPSKEDPCDKYKPSYTSQKDLCDKYLYPLRSNTSQKEAYDKYKPSYYASKEDPCDKYKPSCTSQKDPCDKYLKRVRSNSSQEEPYDKCKEANKSEKRPSDKRSQHRPCDKTLKPVRSNSSQHGPCDLKSEKSNASQKRPYDRKSQHRPCDKNLKRVRSNSSQHGPCDKNLKPVRSNSSQHGPCDFKPARSNTSQKRPYDKKSQHGPCDKNLKRVRSSTSHEEAYERRKPSCASQKRPCEKRTQHDPCDKNLKRVRSSTSHEEAYDKRKTSCASQKHPCEKRPQHDHYDKNLKRVRSSTSQEDAYDKCKPSCASQRLPCDNRSHHDPCDKNLKRVRSSTSHEEVYDQCKPSCPSQRRPYDKYSEPSNAPQRVQYDRILIPQKSTISQKSCVRQRTMDCMPPVKSNICNVDNNCASYDLNQSTSNASKVGPCVSLLAKDSNYNYKPTTSGAVYDLAPSRTSGVGGLCSSLQKSTPAEGSHQPTVKSDGKAAKIETVRHRNEDGSIISIQVLVIPCEEDRKAPIPIQETPSQPDNEAGNKPSSKNDVHLCHCIVPPHISTIPCTAVGVDKPPAPVVRPGLEHLVIQPTASNDIYTYKSNPQTPTPYYTETSEKPVAQTPNSYVIKVPAEDHTIHNEPRMEKRPSFATLHPRAEVYNHNLFDHDPLISILKKQNGEPPHTSGVRTSFILPASSKIEDDNASPREVGPKMTYTEKNPATPVYIEPQHLEEHPAEHPAEYRAQHPAEHRDSQSNLNRNESPSPQPKFCGLLRKSDGHIKPDKEEKIHLPKPIGKRLRKSVSDPGILTPKSVEKVPSHSDNAHDGPEFLTRKPTLMSLEKWEQICEDFKKRINEQKEEEEKLIKESPKDTAKEKVFRKKPKLAAIPENKEVIKADSQVSLKNSSSLNLLFSSNTDGAKITSGSPARIPNVTSQQKRIVQRRVSLTDEEWLRLYEDFLQGSYDRTGENSENPSELYLQDLYPSTDSYEKSLFEADNLRRPKGTINKSYTAAHALTKFDHQITLLSSESSYSDLQLLTELLLCEKEEEDKTFEQWAPLYLDLLSNKTDTFSDDTSGYSTPKSSLHCSIPFSRLNTKEWVSKYYQFLKNSKDIQQEMGIVHSTDSVATNLDISASLGSFSGVSFPEDDNPLSESIDESILIETTSSQQILDGDTCQDILRLDSKLLSNDLVGMGSFESIQANQGKPESVEENNIKSKIQFESVKK